MKYIPSNFFIVLLLINCAGPGGAVTEESSNAIHNELAPLHQNLINIIDSLVQINTEIVYRTYYFHADKLYRIDELTDKKLDDLKQYSENETFSRAGTGIVLNTDMYQTALLTASHTVSYPDTIWHHTDHLRGHNQYVNAVSVLESIVYFVRSGSELNRFELVENDPVNDLAILKLQKKLRNNPDFTPLNISQGNSDNLNWGQKVYVIGYPKGHKMITSGLVSPNKGNRPGRNFIIDSSFNRGFSGGIVLAINNVKNEFEWVGMLTSASAEKETFLIPDPGTEENHNSGLLYNGDLYIGQSHRINYGIAYAVGINQVKEFMDGVQ